MRSEYTSSAIELPNRALPSSLPEDDTNGQSEIVMLQFLLVPKQGKDGNLLQAPVPQLRPHNFLQAACWLHLVFRQQTANVLYYFITKYKIYFL
jgi:hypothetical protein